MTRRSDEEEIEKVRAAKERAFVVLRRLVRVNAVGITKVGARYALKVNLAERPAAGQTLPREVDGVPLVVEVVGDVVKRPLAKAPATPRARSR